MSLLLFIIIKELLCAIIKKQQLKNLLANMRNVLGFSVKLVVKLKADLEDLN